MRAKDGGPAFPLPSDLLLEAEGAGMSLRDYFAGQALANGWQQLATGEDDLSYKDIAKWCYEIADAMLKAREETSHEG